MKRPISSDLRHGAPTPRTLNADYAARVCRREGVSDGTADHLPVPSDDGPSWRNWQCEIADKIGLDFCMCCGRWHRKSRMGDLDGLCRHCSTFVEVNRILRQLSDADWAEIL